jgi:hypothetical protein
LAKEMAKVEKDPDRKSTHTYSNRTILTNTGQLKKALHNLEPSIHELFKTAVTTQHLEQETDIPVANENREFETRKNANFSDTTKRK